MCDVGGEYADVSRSEWSIAAKPHRCRECGGTIPKGDMYLREASLFDGQWDSWKLCAGCDAWRHALYEAQWRECDGETYYEIGGLWRAVADFAAEHLGDATRDRVSYMGQGSVVMGAA